MEGILVNVEQSTVYHMLVGINVDHLQFDSLNLIRLNHLDVKS